MRSTNTSQGWPWYVLVMAVFFPLFLYAQNLGQASLEDLWRPVVLSALVGLLIFGVVYLIFRDKTKAGLMTALIEVFVFSYGHIYNVLKQVALFGGLIGRHRYLIPISLLLIGILLWLIWVKMKDPEKFGQVVSILFLILTGFQLVQIAYYEISSVIAQNKAQRAMDVGDDQTPGAVQRDVYLIVLDTYMRSDWLEDYFGVDNSGFIAQLEDYGFYVAECSRSNYAYTLLSMTAELNMNYLDALDLDYENLALTAKLKNSVVRQHFENQGYDFVFYESGYPGVEMEDADRFIEAKFAQRVRDFEYLYVETTLGLFIEDIFQEFFQNSIDIDLQNYVNRVNSTLEGLQNPIDSDRPLFVYAHIVSPHRPKVFTENGSINTDWEYDINSAAAGTYAYIDNQILKAIDAIMERSDPDPIIILQADHGDTYQSEYRTLILNSYYLPDGGDQLLYSTISPVNTFRVIFNYYFDENYPLLDDYSYFSPDKFRYLLQLVEEPYDYCRDQGTQ
ncbi:hypothetical protein KQH50_00240 [bacterium]|nr:hypothetical protein [bacterium]